MSARSLRKPALRNALPESPLAALVAKRHITRDDVAALRSSDLAMGLRSRAEAELVFAIENGPGEKCRAWGDYMVEALIDFVVWDQRPSGTLTDEAAHWLSDQAGEVPTPASMALLISILEEAETVPAWFLPAVRLRASRAFGREIRPASVQDAA